ncbi:MAG TPA: acetyl-CoA carboxylase biotin carboxylase subunit [Terriglobales bacterium]|nr:acetyl-CoA carboxylase biotin carboxylase subunit [Terriglobales bacterium]
MTRGEIALGLRQEMFKKILIANRGEIAVRLVRACRDMGIASVAVYSDVDRCGMHVLLADEAYRLGPAPASESYLSFDRVLAAARDSGAEAIHPGYGFLAENAEFARACAAAGIVFIGPSPASMDALGSKTAARKLAQQHKIPILQGTVDAVATLAEAQKVAAGIGYPVMLKAAAGGGGKGMRLVASAAEMPSAFALAATEAASAFGDSAVFLERAVLRPRHIEVQILGDQHGHLLSLGERECSVQRRHQKIIEESPAPRLRPATRAALASAALAAARAANYYSAGTVEFLVDADENFYFLEVNTRLQVEHPVTELVTGLDLVAEQIRIAAGEPLSFTQDLVSTHGHAIECRVYAEDPAQNFMPSPGLIRRLQVPSGPGIREDSGVYQGWNVPLDYDPLLSKLIAWGADRDQAVARMRRALQEYELAGVGHNLGFFRRVFSDPDFIAGRTDTGYVGRLQAMPEPAADPELERLAAVAAALAAGRVSAPPPAVTDAGVASSNWQRSARQAGLRGMRS